MCPCHSLHKHSDFELHLDLMKCNKIVFSEQSNVSYFYRAFSPLSAWHRTWRNKTNHETSYLRHNRFVWRHSWSSWDVYSLVPVSLMTYAIFKADCFPSSMCITGAVRDVLFATHFLSIWVQKSRVLVKADKSLWLKDPYRCTETSIILALQLVLIMKGTSVNQAKEWWRTSLYVWRGHPKWYNYCVCQLMSFILFQSSVCSDLA